MNRVLRLISVFLAGLTLLYAADTAAEKPHIGALPVGKILFLGNSITLHGPAPQIGWTGNWGMASSKEELDYVHLVTADVSAAAGTKPKTMVRNIADFERGFAEFDISKELKDQIEFEADLVVIAIGENVPELTTAESRAMYATSFQRLLAEFNRGGQTTIFVRSTFWADPPKDDIMRNASEKTGATFIDISKLGRDTANSARSERKFENEGVAGHPGDKGMRAIANAIFSAIQKRANPPKPP